MIHGQFRDVFQRESSFSHPAGDIDILSSIVKFRIKTTDSFQAIFSKSGITSRKEMRLFLAFFHIRFKAHSASCRMPHTGGPNPETVGVFRGICVSSDSGCLYVFKCLIDDF